MAILTIIPVIKTMRGNVSELGVKVRDWRRIESTSQAMRVAEVITIRRSCLGVEKKLGVMVQKMRGRRRRRAAVR